MPPSTPAAGPAWPVRIELSEANKRAGLVQFVPKDPRLPRTGPHYIYVYPAGINRPAERVFKQGTNVPYEANLNQGFSLVGKYAHLFDGHYYLKTASQGVAVKVPSRSSSISPRSQPEAPSQEHIARIAREAAEQVRKILAGYSLK